MTLTRRDFIAAGAAAVALPALGAEAQAMPPLLLPGPYRGKVVEVGHAEAVRAGKVSRDAVRAMMERGMRELTGAPDEATAWKRFFKPTDTVGIKVCPVGKPACISQPETLLEVVRGLNLAGIPNQNILFINRYEDEYQACGFDKIKPPGVREAFGAPAYDDLQVNTEGYDTTIFAEFPTVMTGADPNNPAHRRSHLCTVVSQVVDKVVNVCVLKDHSSGGITMALKNMSHGMSNNVCRTHIDAAHNWCGTFIPAIVALRRVREKVALHIGDGLIAGYDGGPGVWNPHFKTWERQSLFFATDPVAMDRVGWQIIDRKRAEQNLPPLAETGKKRKDPGHEVFDYRQPEHVLLAGQMGLGESDLAKIQHSRIALKG